MSTLVVLPEQLAPALRERVWLLLTQVSQVEYVPPLDPLLRRPPQRNRCVVCYQGGVLGGHHGADGRIEWVHRSCHRRLHRRAQRRHVSDGNLGPPLSPVVPEPWARTRAETA